MKIKDQFKNAIESQDSSMDFDAVESIADESEKLADKLACDFYEWIKRTRVHNTGIDSKTLLKMFKNQTGLS